MLALVAIAMRLSGDKGPFFYRAPRVGQGETFTVLKVRTMTSGSAGSKVTLANDPRVTRMGRMLRRYRLDELPQLINVMRGEMSLVGPRPEDPAYVDLADPLHGASSRPSPASPVLHNSRITTRQTSWRGPMPISDTVRRSCRRSSGSTPSTWIAARLSSTSKILARTVGTIVR